MSMFKLEPGAKARIAPYGASQIGFVVDGEAVAGGEALRKYTAFSLTQGEACELESAAGMELLLVCLPIISSIDRAAA
jgi:hypothetical protein